MPRVSAFSIAQKDIEKFLDQHRDRPLKDEDISEIFNVNREFWRLPPSWHYYKFIDALSEKTEHFREATLEFPRRTVKRYFWKEISPLRLALSVSPRAYLTHYTAMSYHGLTDQIPKTVYVTTEQTKKEKKGILTQEGIDRAFAKKQRVSKNIANMPNGAVYWLNGKDTNRIGVIKTDDGLPITNIARTLIDAAVRPIYSGGVYEVLEAYKRAAADLFSVNRMAAMLRKMDFIYPYHQVIGFYLERSGAYRPNQIEVFKRFDQTHDFYLTYNMQDKEYSKEWRLYFPKGL